MMIKTVQITKYQTSDGKRWDTTEMAEAHELKMALEREFEKVFEFDDDESRWDSEFRNIDHFIARMVEKNPKAAIFILKALQDV